jgi:hypothetical protein
MTVPKNKQVNSVCDIFFLIWPCARLIKTEIIVSIFCSVTLYADGLYTSPENCECIHLLL